MIKAKVCRCKTKKNKLQDVFTTAFAIHNQAIRLNLLSLLVLFQNTKAEMVQSKNIIVQTIHIKDHAGVNLGKFKVLYQSIPRLV
jgi:hypothetical protein